MIKKRCILMSVLSLFCVASFGMTSIACAEKKKTREIKYESPDSEVSLEIETTEKSSDD
ncbi:MAG: hypothetical protein H6817_04195 [Phycisphaerales bacterium]|nr:hypothetical protein [Phycisphaerales bacterium]